MDIERDLEILIDKHKGKQVGLGEIRLDCFAEDCLKEIRRLKSAIARQSVKSEEVQEAIGDLMDMKEHWCADSTDNDAISIDLAITALQAYEPTTRKNRIVEEVAISKTEITSGLCWYCVGIKGHKVVSVKTVVDECGRELGAYDTPYNYCPACGRKLKENEHDISV